MKNHFLKLLLFFPTLLLANNPIESDTTRIGSTFTDHSIGLENNLEPQKVFLSSNFLYFTETYGFSPKMGDYSPGFRINFGTALPSIDFDIEATYTQWGVHKKQHSIHMDDLKEFSNSYNSQYQLHSIEGKISRNLPLSYGLSIKLFAGIEGLKNQYKSEFSSTRNSSTLTSKRKISWNLFGPLIGIELSRPIKKFYKFFTSLSGTYARGKVKDSCQFYSESPLYTDSGKSYLYEPNLKSKLGFEASVPTWKNNTNISFLGSYETQLYWASRDPYSFKWKTPRNIQGFSAEVRCDF